MSMSRSALRNPTFFNPAATRGSIQNGTVGQLGLVVAQEVELGTQEREHLRQAGLPRVLAAIE